MTAAAYLPAPSMAEGRGDGSRVPPCSVDGGGSGVTAVAYLPSPLMGEGWGEGDQRKELKNGG